MAGPGIISPPQGAANFNPVIVQAPNGHRAEISYDSNDILTVTTRVRAPSSAPTPALAGVGAGVLSAGDYKYKVTYIIAGGVGETEGGPESATVTVVDPAVNGQVALSGIPVGIAGVIEKRKIYRTAANGSVFKLVTTINDNTTTTYTDNTSDAALGVVIPTANSAEVTSFFAIQSSTLNVPGGVGEGVEGPIVSATTLTVKSGKFQLCDAASIGLFTVTMPLAAQCPYGVRFTIKKIDAGINVVTVARQGADSVEFGTSVPLAIQGSSVTLQSDGISNWYKVAGV